MAKHSSVHVYQDLQKIVKFFKLYHLDYMLIGGLALSVWGRPRLTLDLDFLVLVDGDEVEKLENWALKQKFKIDKNWMHWNPLLKGTQLRLQVGNLTVDLMVPRDDHDRKAFARKRHRKLGKAVYQIIAPEDFILQKLKVGRPRDFEDAVNVLECGRRKLNMTYLKKWARKLSISAELSYIVNA